MQVRPGEPVYAQVNRDKKRSRGAGGEGGQFDAQDYSDHAHHWAVQDNSGQNLDTSGGDRNQQQPPAGDSGCEEIIFITLIGKKPCSVILFWVEASVLLVEKILEPNWFESMQIEAVNEE